jgi:arabinofuranosyltransferase
MNDYSIFPPMGWSILISLIGRTYRTQGRQVRIETAVGMIGYFAGPEVHIVDIWAICDPLLARLDTLETDWRIGHYTRPVIDGYLETLQTGENRIKDPAIARYYSNLKIIVSGELWSWKRFETIWKMNTGQYDYLLDRTE